MTKTHKKLILILAKVVIGGGLIVFVGHRLMQDWPGVSGSIAGAFRQRPFYLVLGVIVFVGVYVLGNIRWLVLLRPHGVRLPYWAATKLWFIGHFFAQYMPGGIAGGDLIKSYYVATHREAAGRRAEAVSTVFLDRFLGIIGLISVLLVAVVVNLRRSSAHRQYWLMALAMLTVAIVVAVLLFSKPLLKKLPLVMRLYARLPYRDRVKRVYDAFHFYRTRPVELVVAWVLSLFVHMTTALEAYLFGLALGLGYSYLEYVLLLSVANFIASIPISPVGNVGTLETACMGVFGKAGGLPLAILIRIAYLLWGMPGLIYFLTHREEMPHEAVAETVDVIEHDAEEPGDGAGQVQPQEVPADD